MRLLIATGNAHKAGEFREMLGGASERFTFIDLAELADDPTLPAAPVVEETGSSFLANACIKAAAYGAHYRTWALADDSGLEVDALGSGPGVRSARWAADHSAGRGDGDNNALVLKQLAGVAEEKRTGRFVCVLAVADAQGRVVLTARGTVEGRILEAGRGSNGFGYDPLFFVPGLGRTTAELTAEEKHAVSHRGNALRVLRGLLPSIRGE